MSTTYGVAATHLSDAAYFKIILVIFALMAFSLHAAPVFAASGSVDSLTASGGANPGDNINISTTVRATSRIQESNLLFQIIAPDGTLVATHLVDQNQVPSLNPNQTFSYAFTINNSSFPLQGTYTVSLCWSTGNATNCDIASASTTFFSANSLGPALLLALTGVLGFGLWRRRDLLFAGARHAR